MSNRDGDSAPKTDVAIYNVAVTQIRAMPPLGSCPFPQNQADMMRRSVHQFIRLMQGMTTSQKRESIWGTEVAIHPAGNLHQHQS